MTTTKWTINIAEQQDLSYLDARFNEKGCLPCGGGDALRSSPPKPFYEGERLQNSYF